MEYKKSKCVTSRCFSSFAKSSLEGFSIGVSQKLFYDVEATATFNQMHHITSGF
jgi:hypothetical protein